MLRSIRPKRATQPSDASVDRTVDQTEAQRFPMAQQSQHTAGADGRRFACRSPTSCRAGVLSPLGVTTARIMKKVPHKLRLLIQRPCSPVAGHANEDHREQNQDVVVALGEGTASSRLIAEEPLPLRRTIP
jgi:hypothetical protein